MGLCISLSQLHQSCALSHPAVVQVDAHIAVHDARVSLEDDRACLREVQHPLVGGNHCQRDVVESALS